VPQPSSEASLDITNHAYRRIVAVDQLVIPGLSQGSEYRLWVNAHRGGTAEDPRQVPNRRRRADVIREGQIPRASTTGAHRDRFVLRSDNRPRQARITTGMSRLTRPPTDADKGDRA
jgi:hypothetical protein